MIRQINDTNVSGADTSLLHVRFDGQSCDVPLRDLDLGSQSTDRDIKQRLATYLSVPLQSFANYKVDRHQTGNLTLRPEAIFG